MLSSSIIVLLLSFNYLMMAGDSSTSSQYYWVNRKRGNSLQRLPLPTSCAYTLWDKSSSHALTSGRRRGQHATWEVWHITYGCCGGGIMFPVIALTRAFCSAPITIIGHWQILYNTVPSSVSFVLTETKTKNFHWIKAKCKKVRNTETKKTAKLIDTELLRKRHENN